ncbi:hypothetical protein [Sporosarcina highlanderae]|uniref:VCBS repeat-containing protein n=1 Tax=Sporosarcina highlanderae TaxID=3035916 RepID=A0ABT8JWZ5_9BACL|nr:hypothetical protein [Sporosarcina highlanderae]MDN4608669.1 hypothetical protein [Sporosarcina highlanderae]
MNRVLVCCVAACLIGLMIKPVKSMAIEKVVGKIPEANIYLYATEREGNLEKFRLEANGVIQYFPFWINVSNETYWPQLIYHDINHDGKKELIIILTQGYGTGIILQEVHVLHNTETNIGNVYREMIVDNPMAILLKNVKTKLTKSEAIITIGKEKTVIKIDTLGIEPENLFSDVVTDNLIRFEVIDNQLTALIGAQIAPVGGYIGSFYITYKFQNGLYEGTNVEFVHSD